MPDLWITPEELPSAYAGSVYAYEACSSASLIMWGLSGRKYHGRRTVTETYECPCTSEGSHRVLPRLDGFGQVINSFDCGCVGAVRGVHTRLRLKGQPVIEVHEVTRGSAVVDPDAYALVNRSMIQAPSGGLLDVCGMTVTYTYGVSPPTLGVRAASELAVEFIKDWDDDFGDCQLPDRVSSVSRQGVSYTILDDQSYLNDLRTGLYTVDLFLRTINPAKAIRPARVFSPDLPRMRRRTSAAVRQPVGPLDLVIAASGPTVWTRTLAEINGAPFFAQDAWTPIAQITGAHGALILEIDPSSIDVDLAAGTITITLSDAETDRISDVGVLDIYAEGASNLAHVLTAAVRPHNTVGV